MKEILSLQLRPNQHQRAELLRTMETFNRALQYAIDLALDLRCADAAGLEPVVYPEIRFRYELSPQFANRAIRHAAARCRTGGDAGIRIDAHEPLVLDGKMLSFRGFTRASILCLEGRQVIPARFLGYQRSRKGFRKGQAQLTYRNGEFELDLAVELSPPPEPVAEEE